MNKWGTYNGGLYATYMIERSINIVGKNVVELGAGNGRLTNWLMDIGIDVVSYDESSVVNGRMRSGNINVCKYNNLDLYGQICLAFDIINGCELYNRLYNNFDVVIGKVEDEKLIDGHTIWFKGHDDSKCFISCKDIGLLDLITSQIVIDYLVVGRFSGITPSVRKLICALRDDGYKVHTTLPRINGYESYSWLRRKCRIHTVLINNTTDWEWQLRTSCYKDGVPIITFEDGFIPHYSSFHFDRRGFCWNSSVPFKSASNYEPVKPPRQLYDYNNPGVSFDKFVFIPLQTRGDSTILHGSDIINLEDFIRRIKRLIPDGYGLVVKNHPKERFKINNINGVKIVDSGLGWLLENADVVAGINSTTLIEASLVFKKPVYYFGKSWYDNHHKVCKFNDFNTSLEPYEVDMDYRYKFWSMLSSMQCDYTNKISGHELVKTIKNQFMPHKRYAISIVTFGDEYEHFKECFDSIVKHTPIDDFNLIIGCNDVSDRIKNYIRLKMLEVNVYPIFNYKNVGKANMMQKILLYVNSDYLINFDDDSYVINEGWHDKIINIVENSYDECVLWGRQFGVGFGDREKEFLRLCRLPGEYNKDRSIFIQGAFYCVDINFLLKIRCPDDRIKTKSEDVYMGLMVQSCGKVIKDIGKHLGNDIKYNTSDRG